MAARPPLRYDADHTVEYEIVRHEPATAQTRAAYVFLAPAALLISVFFVIPVLASLLLSLTDFDIYAGNYIRLVHDPVFWKALVNTFYFALVGGPLTIAASLGAALLLSSKLVRWQGFFRTIYFAPFVTTLVAVAIVWKYLYHPQYGLLNFALGKVGVHRIDWLGDPHWAMPAIIVMSVWKNFGYNMLIFVAALQSVPQELYEAAELDGAGAVKRFWHITVPMLGPALAFVGIVTMIGYFQLFSEPYVMTQGGPLRATTSVVLYMYEEGFRWWRMGFAAAIAFVLFIIIAIATTIQRRFVKAEP